ncbi:MAG: hypothetical protein QM817_12105 [Archangium sp.]
MKRDTPVDTPSVGEIIEAPQLGIDAAALGSQALVRVRSVETLEALYAAWTELNASAVSARRKWKEEQRRLEEQGELLLGAMRAAASSQPAGEGLVVAARDAEAKLVAVRTDFAKQVSSAEATLSDELERLRAELFERVKRQATVSRPAFRLAVRSVGERRILHAHRLSDDDAVMALFAFTSRIPSRYGYLADDSVDDVKAAPPSLYSDEGVSDVRPTAAALRLVLNDRAQMWPVKGQLPLVQGERFVRWITRGAVLEAELAEGDGWRNLLTREEAEQLTGLLLTLKLAGKIEFELVRD